MPLSERVFERKLVMF